MARAVPAVFTIAPGADFAAELVAALLDGTLLDIPFAEAPERLADLVIHVPTRRTRPLIEAAFARALAPRAAILPRIRPLGEPADPLDPGYDLAGDLAEAETSGARAIGVTERRFHLLPLVSAWHRRLVIEGAVTGPLTLAEGLALSDQLARLIDEMRIAGVPLASLASTAPPGYDPARFDEYWAKSRDFLRIAAEFWPAHLAEIGARDVIDQRLASLEREAGRLARADRNALVLVAGSTGSVPATQALMRAVARLDHGAVVLPGLDLDLDEAGWQAIGAMDATIASRFAHPQASLKRTLTEIGVPRAAVRRLGPDHARNRLLSEAMRPAETLAAWRENAAGPAPAEALAGLRVVEAADQREEALAIAILMRETLEAPGKRVALVTADRGLAERVGAELRRFGVEAADSAGLPLGDRPAGALARLLLRAAERHDGVALLAMMRHAFFRLGRTDETARRLTDALEILVLRGRHFSSATMLAERTRHALESDLREGRAAAAIPGETRADLHAFAAEIDALLAPFGRKAAETRLGDLARDLGDALERITRLPDGSSLIADDADGRDLLDLLAELAAHGGGVKLAPVEFGPALDLLLARHVLPPGAAEAPRAAILGLLEARLVSADRIILGGLNEGTFPPAPTEDAFLNRPMRLDLGLQPPEWRIGQSAHDFAMLAGHADLVLTRAKRVNDQPSLPSRFLRRLEAFLGKAPWDELVAQGAAVLALGRALDDPGDYAPAEPPAPVPAAPRVPERLSITDIEKLRRDPYAIYARAILGLEPLEPIEPEPDARERGTMLHAILERYAATEPPLDPERAAQHLREIGTEHFRAIGHERELHEFWWRQFEAIIPSFIAFDRMRREAGNRVLTERRGALGLDLPSGDRVTISGKADRLELNAAGRLAVFDYKSGKPPSANDVKAGLAPQLPITAALALQGGFAGLPTEAIGDLAYVAIGGAGPVERKPLAKDITDLGAFARADWERLAQELARHADGTAAYASRLHPVKGRAGDFDHLARAGEWQGVEEPGEDEEEEA